ncbi:MAG: hypothetical protein N2067_09335 [Spirochaetaceae bacterium]|nr:hypothetical protein [Spirochaetaceae bacterium]
MKSIRHRNILLACGILLLLGTGLAHSLDSSDGTWSIMEKQEIHQGACLLTITVQPGSAVLVLDGRTLGRGSYKGPVSPGSHMLLISAPDHHTLSIPFRCAPDTAVTITASLAPYTGFVILDVWPDDAEILIDGRPLKGTFAELPVGMHTVTARKFGYREQSTRFLIIRNTLTRTSLMLPVATFDITGISVSRERFNPRNGGPYGRTTLQFRVTAPGSGEVHVLDGRSQEVARAIFPSFIKWQQSFTWDGMLGDGPVPDGRYRFDVSAQGDDGRKAQATREVIIDSTLMFHPSGGSGGFAGLASFPWPDTATNMPGGITVWAGGGTEGPGLGLDLAFSGRSIAFALDSSVWSISGPAGSRSALGVVVPISNGKSMKLAAAGRTLWGTLPEATSWKGNTPAIQCMVPASIQFGTAELGVAPAISLPLDGSSPVAGVSLGLRTRSSSLSAGASFWVGWNGMPPLTAGNPLAVRAEVRGYISKSAITWLVRSEADISTVSARLALCAGLGLAF